MPISVQCSSCGKTLNVKDEMAGKRGKCPQCGAVIEVPQPGAIPQAPPPPPSPPPQAAQPPSAGGPVGAPVVMPQTLQQQPGGQKSWLTALLLSIFLGGCGIDRFYLGYIGLGIAKLLTGGGCGVWYVIDLILIATGKMTDADGNALQK